MDRRCRSCRAPVMFAPSCATGSTMILDAAPTPAGNVTLTTDLLGDPCAMVLGPDAAEAAAARDEVLYVDHHATCEHAEEWTR